jgi:hypothetical protein
VKLDENRYLVIVETEGYIAPKTSNIVDIDPETVIDMNDCTEPFYIAKNRVTVKAKPCAWA